MTVIKKIIMKTLYKGLPKESDMEIVEETLPDLKENEFRYKVLYVSVDPYLRAYAGKGYKEGDVVIALTLTEVVESKNPNYPVGAKAVIHCGWRTGGISDGKDVWYSRDDMPENLPLSGSLGVLGMPALTAYFGLLEVCQLKPGETVFVNGCAGAVGNVVGQIAKIKGCKVFGSCGSDDKVDFAKSIGFDDAFNYKTEKSPLETLKRMAPNGIDCFFDNVGGRSATPVLMQMNRFGRIAQCGCISTYNATEPPMAEVVQMFLVGKELSMKGFNVVTYMEKFPAAYDDMKKWCAEGKLKHYETMTEGFENIPKSFISMLTGGNIGKAIVKI